MKYRIDNYINISNDNNYQRKYKTNQYYDINDMYDDDDDNNNDMGVLND